MAKRENHRLFACLGVLALTACSFSGGSGSEFENDNFHENDGGVDLEMVLVDVSGNIADFITGEPIEGATLEGVDLSDGLVGISGSSFTISGVVPFSIFRLKASAPGYATTISSIITVADTSVSDVTIEIVTQQLADEVHLEAGIGAPTGGLVAARLRDTDTSAPVVGVAEDAFTDGTVVFLDGNQVADGAIPSSTTAGIAFIANVGVGLVDIVSARPEQHFFVAPTTRVEEGLVSVVNINVGAEAPAIPDSNYFDVLGVLSDRGCNNCHQGEGPGVGALDLGGRLDDRYDRLVLRLDFATPEDSLLLRKPSFEDPVDGHQVVFANKFDPDYLTLLGWAMNGADVF